MEERDRDLGEKPSNRREFADLPGNVPQRSDEDILKGIESILFYDELVRSLEVKIHVVEGVVTLDGTVSDVLERRRAESDAYKVPGVKQVINQLQISQQAGR